MSAVICMRNAPSRVLLVGLVAVALVASGIAPVAGDAPSPPSSSSLDAGPSAVGPSVADSSGVGFAAVGPATAGSAVVEQTNEPFDPTTATRIRIEPTPDGDARWTVSVRYALTGEMDRAAFDAVGDRFVDGEIGPEAALFEGFAREASRNVDRTMRIEDVDREAVVHEDPSSFDVASEETTAVGEFRLTFVWTEFLEEDGENLVLGDALTTPDGGTWLLSLEAGQTLEVATPEGYTVTGTSDAPDRLSNNAVIVEGPRVFGEGERVAVVYAPAAAPPWTMLAAAIVVAAVLIAGSIVGYRRVGGDAPDVADDPVSENAVDSDGGAPADRGDRRDGDGAAGAGSAAGAGDTAAGADTADRSLLSDEERVERLLEDNGGRMRQADIVSETGWSDAKVSQLLSAMADSGRVEKLRLGRENLISVRDEDGDTDTEAGGSDVGAGSSDAEAGGDKSER